MAVRKGGRNYRGSVQRLLAKNRLLFGLIVVSNAVVSSGCLKATVHNEVMRFTVVDFSQRVFRKMGKIGVAHSKNKNNK